MGTYLSFTFPVHNNKHIWVICAITVVLDGILRKRHSVVIGVFSTLGSQIIGSKNIIIIYIEALAR